MRDRGWRRTQRARRIAAIEGWLRDRRLHSGGRVTVDEANERYRDWARRRHGAPADCSGFCCGNPRRHFHEPTLSERRAIDGFDDQDFDV